MNLLLLAGIVASTAAVGVTLMYVARRLARIDVFLTDTTRGSAIFGVIGTAFAVLLAFVMFVAFQSYSDAREAAAAEASAVGRLFRTAGFFPPRQRDQLRADLVCYARAVTDLEWPAMADRERSPAVDRWRLELEDTLTRLELGTELQQAGFRQLLVERDERSDARGQRLDEADPVVSAPVWAILGLGGAATIGFVLLFTDRREAFLVQGAMMAIVSGMVAASLILVWFLDHPYEAETGSVRPVDMERAISDMEREQPTLSLPCTPRGTQAPA